MTVKEADAIRNALIEKLMDFFKNEGEEVGRIASNKFNFPFVTENREESWVEIVVQIPKEDDGYDKQEEYRLKCKEKAEKAAEAAKKKAAKVAADKAKREAKAAEKAAKTQKEG